MFSVAGFEEVVEEVELGATPWDNLKSSPSSSSLNQAARISTDPNPDVFFTLIEETVASPGLLASPPGQEGGEVIVEKIYEMKDDLCFTEGSGTPEIKVEPIDSIEHSIDDSQEHVIETMTWIKEEKPEYLKEEVEVSPPEIRKTTRVRVVAYHCSDCMMHFVDEADYKAHMEAHLVKLQNSCALCNTEFETKSELQEHIKDHFSKNSSNTCHTCKQTFMSKSGLKRHRKQLHNFGTVLVLNPSSLKCGQCQETFSDKASLRQHAAVHASKKPFRCAECGATFTQNGSLQVHIRRHSGEKPFSCQLCGNNFTRAHSLKVHMKTHTGEKPFSCEYCGASFVTSSHLTVHRRTHTGERPYSCSDCGATFITTSHLNVHRRVHGGGGNVTGAPVGCSQCQASFSDPAQLRLHRRTHHRSSQTQSQVTCKVCEKRFPNHRQLNNHECG